MAHRGVSNTAVSTGAVCVAGVPTADLYYFSGLWGFENEKATQNIYCSLFEISVLILREGLMVNLSLQKVKMSFLYIQCVFYYIIYRTIFLSFQFSWDF